MKKKNINLILAISIFIALLAISAFIFLFKIIKNKNEHASKVLITLAEKTENKKNAQTLTKKFAELKNIHQEINNHFIDPAQIDTFVEYLEKLGVDNGTELVVKNVEILTKEKNNILVKVLVTGNFTNIMKVVYLLENAPYYINLNQVFINKDNKTIEQNIEGVKKETVTSFWQGDISFNILSLPQ